MAASEEARRGRCGSGEPRDAQHYPPCFLSNKRSFCPRPRRHLRACVDPCSCISAIASCGARGSSRRGTWGWDSPTSRHTRVLATHVLLTHVAPHPRPVTVSQNNCGPRARTSQDPTCIHPRATVTPTCASCRVPITLYTPTARIDLAHCAGLRALALLWRETERETERGAPLAWGRISCSVTWRA